MGITPMFQRHRQLVDLASKSQAAKSSTVRSTAISIISQVEGSATSTSRFVCHRRRPHAAIGLIDITGRMRNLFGP